MVETIWRKKGIPPLNYCTLDRASGLLGCELYDLLHLAEIGKIELCLRFDTLHTMSSFIFFNTDWLVLPEEKRRDAVNNWISQQGEFNFYFPSLPSGILTRIAPARTLSETFSGLEINFDLNSYPLCSVDGFLCIDTGIDAKKLSQGHSYELIPRFKVADNDQDEQWYLHRAFFPERMVHRTELLSASELWITRKQIEIVYDLITGAQREDRHLNQYVSLGASGRPQNPHKNRILSICSETRRVYPDVGLNALAARAREYLISENEKNVPSQESISNWLKEYGLKAANHNKKIEFELVIPDNCRGNN